MIEWLAKRIVAHIVENPDYLASIRGPEARQRRSRKPRWEVVHRDEVVLEVGAWYEILHCERAATFWGYLDFSEARNGDAFRLRLYTRIHDQWVRYQEFEIRGEQENPAWRIALTGMPGLRAELAQTSGIGKRVPYEWYGRFEGNA